MTYRLQPSKGEVWRHFRGGTYTIIACAFDAVSEERGCDVIYQSDLSKTVWKRPLENFMGTVPNPRDPSTTVFRFEVVKTAS